MVFVVFNGWCIGFEVMGEWGFKGICIRILICSSVGGVYKIGVCLFDFVDVKCCLVGCGFFVGINFCGGVLWCDWIFNICSGSWLIGSFLLCFWFIMYVLIKFIGYCFGGFNYKCCRF